MSKRNKKPNEELLIQIILYLLLSLAFFSSFIDEKTGRGIDEKIGERFDRFPIVVFMFGILAIVFLYIGQYSNKSLNKAGKAFGYLFSGVFIILFGGFLFIYFQWELTTEWDALKELFFMKSLQWALSISLIISISLLVYLIVKTIKPIKRNEIKDLVEKEVEKQIKQKLKHTFK